MARCIGLLAARRPHNRACTTAADLANPSVEGQ